MVHLIHSIYVFIPHNTVLIIGYAGDGLVAMRFFVRLAWFVISIRKPQRHVFEWNPTDRRCRLYLVLLFPITIIRPCNILRYLPMKKYQFSDEKNLIYFLIFAQNIDCEAVLTRYHNLCFRAKIRKLYIPLHPVLLYKSGV